MLKALKLQSRMENRIEGSSLQNTGPRKATPAAMPVRVVKSLLDMVVMKAPMDNWEPPLLLSER